MKRLLSAFIVTTMILCSSVIAFGNNDSVSLDDIINGETSQSTQVEQNETQGSTETDRQENNQAFIDGLNDAANLSKPVEGVTEVTSGLKLAAAWVVQILSYAITILLAIRVVLDLAYIGLPFCRTFLSNGYQGNAQAGAGGMPNSMAGSTGMNPSGLGMGMSGGFGMGVGGNNMAMNRMGMANMGANQNGAALGRIQWVSNAALNAVAGESTVGPNGKGVSPFKTYCKDMVVILVLVPILMTLAITGALTNFGFLLGELLVDGISSIGNMI